MENPVVNCAAYCAGVRVAHVDIDNIGADGNDVRGVRPQRLAKNQFHFRASPVEFDVFDIRRDKDCFLHRSPVDIFAEFGIQVTIGQFWFWFMVFLLFAVLLAALGNYASLHHQSYTIFPDKVVVQKSGFLSGTGKIIEVPFANIASVSLKSASFPASTSALLQVSGKDFDKVTLDFLDDGATIVEKLESLVQQHKGRVFSQFGHEYRVGQIVGGP